MVIRSRSAFTLTDDTIPQYSVKACQTERSIGVKRRYVPPEAMINDASRLLDQLDIHAVQQRKRLRQRELGFRHRVLRRGDLAVARRAEIGLHQVGVQVVLKR